MKRSDNYLINDIKESIKSIEEYLSELKNKENFLSDRRMQKLMIYEIIIQI